jgi:anti-anti-sigma factor
MADTACTVREEWMRVVFVGGEVDISTVGLVESALLGSGSLRVDCRDVTFMGVAGYRALAEAYERCEKERSDFVVCGLTDYERRIAELMNLHHMLCRR